jgi:hypothetical protein
MRKRKTLLERIGTKVIYNDNKIKISREGNEWFFEIGKELTTDLAEAVSILIRKCDKTNPIWNIELREINIDDITPKKSLYWLTGGDAEWKSLEHYNKPWCDCYLDFQEEFGFLIVNIIKRSKNLDDIRKYFLEYLNLPTLYEFALSKNLVR